MPRPDGRLEPGQPLRGAISARAWNRAQDAADLVLGANTGIAAGEGVRDFSRLVAPVRVYGACAPGTAVHLTGSYPAKRLGTQAQSGTLSVPYGGYLQIEYLSGFPTSLSSGAFPVAVTLGGSGDLDVLGSSVVPCVIRGLAVVRVRLFSGSHFYAVPPFAKGNENNDSGKYTGILDSSPCACDGSVRVIAYDVDAPASTVMPENAPIAWATVII
ncbi:MAG: hypothetical protein EBR82_25200 [Caulobacteraceae bacterium]|nr:hypothetical protein [Caulobacteraceae bacterium]